MLLEAHRYSGSFGHQWKKCKPFEIPSFKHKTCFLLVGRQKGVDETCISDQFFFSHQWDKISLGYTKQDSKLHYCIVPFFPPPVLKHRFAICVQAPSLNFRTNRPFFFLPYPYWNQIGFMLILQQKTTRKYIFCKSLFSSISSWCKI